MKKLGYKNVMYVSATAFLFGAVSLFAPLNVSAQVYYGNYNNGYNAGYGMYGYGYGVSAPRREVVRHPFYPLNNYQPYYNNYNNYYLPTYGAQLPYYQYNSPLSVSCSAGDNGYVAGSYVMWNAHVSGGSGYYTYSWSGTDNPMSLNANSINVSYQIPGTKYMNVTVTSGDGQIATAYCGSANVAYSYPSYNNYPYQYSPMMYQQPVPYNYGY